MGNPVVHFQIGAADPARARDFYTALFGWSVGEGPGGYELVNTGIDGTGTFAMFSDPDGNVLGLFAEG